MKFDISRSIYPDGKIRFIARDKDRIVRFREDTLEEIQKAIKTYKEPPPVEEEIPVEAASAESSGPLRQSDSEASEPKKKFLTNKLAEKVRKRKEEQEVETKHLPGVPQAQHHLEGEESEEEKKQPKKKSFWDRLK